MSELRQSALPIAVPPPPPPPSSTHLHLHPPPPMLVHANFMVVFYTSPISTQTSSTCQALQSPSFAIATNHDLTRTELANMALLSGTGDSARHDNDNRIPRTPAAIYQMNRVLATRMKETFPDIPIVPSIGNNDIWPHNVMAPGPNGITKEYINIWRAFIPFSSYQVFQHGGYFSKEVIYDHLAVISLNTMYWYDANKAVGGCEYHAPNDPGNQQFDWLDVQLQQFRDRGMQVILMGHVPPSPGNYFPDCHFRYGQTAIRYQDTIVGHFFGHMNVDHFFWLDVHDLSLEPTEPDPILRSNKVALHEDLRDDISNLPKRLHSDDYIVVNVGPSVLPAYLPSFRIYQYNISDYAGAKVTDEEEEVYTLEKWDALRMPNEGDDDDEDDWDLEDGDDEDVVLEERKHPRPQFARSNYINQRLLGSDSDGVGMTGKRRHRHRHPELPDCSKRENAEKYACRPWGPRHANASSPSRENRLWSLLGYAQYYLPDIDRLEDANTSSSPSKERTKEKGGRRSMKGGTPKFKLEYLTFSIDALRPPNTTNITALMTTMTMNGTSTNSSFPLPLSSELEALWKKQKKWIPPIPKHLLPKSLRQVNRTRSKFVPYAMDDLTIPNWIGFARRLGKSNKMWKRFLRFMYMGLEVDDGDSFDDPEEEQHRIQDVQRPVQWVLENGNRER
ncbi:Endopolyphosphatase [Serendipita sp. 399]|nr:Endopolyphosphatase [Serendipita sp. 399]